jgi:hypothetical protein
MMVKNERLTGSYIAKHEPALYEEMVSLVKARKANSEFEISPYRNDYNKLSPMARFYIAMLPVVEKTWFDWMQPDGFDREQQFFVVKDDNAYFIVDMQGYDYIRYVGVLDNFVPVEEDEEVEEIDIIDRATGLTRIGDHEIFENVVSNLCTDLSEDGFSKKDALIFLQAFLDHKFDCVVETRKYLFQ